MGKSGADPSPSEEEYLDAAFRGWWDGAIGCDAQGEVGEEGGVAKEEVRSAAEAGTREAGARPMAGAVGDRRPATCYGEASLTGGGGQVGTSGEDDEDRDRLRFLALGSNPSSAIATTTHSATSMEPTPAAQRPGDRKRVKRKVLHGHAFVGRRLGTRKRGKVTMGK